MSGRSLLRLLTGLLGLSLVLSLCSVALAQEGATGLADSPWPKFKRDAQNTGQSPSPSIIEPFVKWTFLTGNIVRSSPVIAPDGTIYIGSEDHFLYALNRDGTLRWSFETWGQINGGAPAIASDGTIYVGSLDVATYMGKLYALRPDGTLKWVFDVGRAHDSLSPTVARDGTIYFGAWNLYAVNPDGTMRWSYPTGAPITVTPALGADGTVYVLAHDAKLYAVNPDGSLKWSYTTLASRDGNLGSAPCVGAQGTIYFGTVGDNRIYALNPDGSLEWTFQANAWIRTSPSIASDGTIYTGELPRGMPDSRLYAINPDGNLKWAFETEAAPVGTSPALASDGTIVFSAARHLYALNPDGSLAWELEIGWGVTAPALDSDGSIYIGSSDGKLYAIGGEVRAITAAIDLDPDTLNLKSKGKWVTVYIELPQGYGVSDVVLSSVALTTVGDVPITPIYAESSPSPVGDHDGDSVPDLMLKFDRQTLQQQLTAGSATTEVSGRLTSGTRFKGSDTVRVLN